MPWTKYDPLPSVTLGEMLSIIDDALCNGFEFKVENHSLYFREITTTQ